MLEVAPDLPARPPLSVREGSELGGGAGILCCNDTGLG